jgi:hypothetical protein
MNIDTRPIEFGMKEIAKSIRTQAQIHKEMEVGKAIIAMTLSGVGAEEATTIVNKAFVVRDHSAS